MAKTKETSTMSFEEMLAKKIGKGAIIDVENIPPIEKFPSGCLPLDIELKGGFPKGKMVEMYADPACGKTTLAISAAKEFQKKYPEEYIMWLDLENVYDNAYNLAIGLDTTHNFFLLRPKTGEDVWEAMIAFAKTHKGGLIVIDSVALIMPITEDEGDMGKAQMAAAARLNSQGFRKIWAHMSVNDTSIIAINQLRADLSNMYGVPTTTGGKGWEFYSRVRLRLFKSKPDTKDMGELQNTRIRLDKATYGNETATAESRIVYGKGFDTEWELVQIASDLDIINKAGSWYSYGDNKIGQGADSVISFFEDNPELMEEIKNKVYTELEV